MDENAIAIEKSIETQVNEILTESTDNVTEQAAKSRQPKIHVSGKQGPVWP